MAAVLGLALAACSTQKETAHTHPTIVSMNPCTDAILAEVADPQQILALSAYSRDPASSSMDVAVARRFGMVHGTAEELAVLRPDVVVSGNFVSPATAAALGKMGLRLEQVPIAATVEASKAQVRQLAAMAGHPARGEALVARIDAALAQAAPPPGAPISTVVWQSGGMVPGRDTLISDLLSRTGFANAAAARGMKQADLLPLEAMLAAPPQLILTAGSAAADEDRLLRHPALAGLSQTRRAPLDPSLLWCGGPTIIRAAKRLGEVRRSMASPKEHVE